MLPKDAKNVGVLEGFLEDIEILYGRILLFREGRREVALALTKLDEARLWLGESCIKESDV